MRSRQHVNAAAAILGLAATLALGSAPDALGRDRAAPASAVEQLVRQEDARRKELASYDAVARQRELSAMLDARERAIVGRREIAGTRAQDDLVRLDPAIRAAMIARAAAAAPTASAAQGPSGDGGFAWGAAALGLGIGVAGMCVLLGCVTLVRHDGRLRSA